MTALSLLTTTPTYPLYATYLQDSKMLLKPFPSCRKSSLNMGYQRQWCLIMDPSSALFTEFSDEWKITQVTSSPHHPEGNGFTKSTVKVVKQILQCAKYSGHDPHLALLSYRATPLDRKIASPAELLYWLLCYLQSTLPSHLRNTAPIFEGMQEALNNHANKSKANHDCTTGPERVPFYTGQDISV